MTGLKWVRLETSLPGNHKMLALVGRRGGHRAVAVYAFGLAHSGAQGHEGFIPREALPLIHGKPGDADLLVAAGLWVEDPGGWTINGWADYQPTSEEQEQRTRRARAAAMARWDQR